MPQDFPNDTFIVEDRGTSLICRRVSNYGDFRSINVWRNSRAGYSTNGKYLTVNYRNGPQVEVYDMETGSLVFAQ